MIIGIHALIYADDAVAARAFFRDVVGWPHVDAHEGWPIFKSGPSELGVNPTSDERRGRRWSTNPHHKISLICDDLDTTVSDMKAKGAEFAHYIRDDGFGRNTMLKVPGGGEVTLYQPRNPTAYGL